ncbi:calcium-binding protein [uncultured Tateyamaria sp.]|uniref:calcium-binding protein n=1 Tax=uncultured Tateyamaria sp. TaxID=455651 RepID=UPI0026328814|nr:calcium-binding protein [uncultured Tateyamaria sp.]
MPAQDVVTSELDDPLGGLYVTASGFGAPNAVFGYNSDTGEMDVLTTASGEAFTTYGRVFHVFGESFIAGAVQGGVGTELYRITEDNNLELFLDIRVGEQSSFLRGLNRVGQFGDTQFFTSRARIDSDAYQEVYITMDGEFGLVADLPENTEFFVRPNLLDGHQQVVTTQPTEAGNFVPVVYSPEQDAFVPFGHVTDEFSASTFSAPYIDDGVLYVRVVSPEGDNRVVFLNENNVWQDLTGTLSGSFAWGPFFVFAANGYHFYLGNSNSQGIELYRVDPENGEFEFATNTHSPLRSSLSLISVLEIGDRVLFYAVSGNLQDTLYTINEDGDVEEWVGNIPTTNHPGFRYIIDVETGRVFEPDFLNPSNSPDYLFVDGALVPFQLPEGDIETIDVLNGAIFVSTQMPDGSHQLWHITLDNVSQLVAEFPEYPFGLDVTHADHVYREGSLILRADEDDFVTSRAVDTTIITRGGDDTVVGGSARDQVYGGTGHDSISGHGGNDVLDGGTGDDIVTGGSGSDTLHGADGNDTLNGGTGNDSLSGGRGDDTLMAGTGADALDGDRGSDVIVLTGATYHTSGFEAFNISSDTQVGTGARVNLEGLVHIEAVIDGGLGADIVQLSEEGDAFFLHDAFSGFHSSVALTEDHDGNASAARFINIEVIRGMGGDDVIDLTSPDYSLAGVTLSINGGAGHDVIWGSDANESISGGSGNDTLFGGTGTDVLTGGEGADVFEFTRTSTDASVTDFDPSGGDILRFYNAGGAEFDAASVALTAQGILISFSDVTSGITQSLSIDLAQSPADFETTLSEVLGALEIL